MESKGLVRSLELKIAENTIGSHHEKLKKEKKERKRPEDLDNNDCQSSYIRAITSNLFGQLYTRIRCQHVIR